jgi:CRISPR system Cascade subunit CasA
VNELSQSANRGFDLFRQPWITCVSPDGGVEQYGIEGLLASADKLSEIIDPSPLVVASVVRLLEAVLLSALAVDDEDDWLDLWERGRFDDDAMRLVGERCSGGMDLFDAERPFFQSSDIDPAGESERVKSVGYLFPDTATGTAVVHYAHAPESAHAFCPVCCAKGLVMLPAFATSGGQGIKPSINGVPPLYVLPIGRSLFETLLLNYVLPLYRPPGAAALDPGPCWLTGGVVGHKEERASAGFVESLTWPARRVRLLAPVFEGACTRCGCVTGQLTRRIVLDQGVSRPKDAAPWIDPWAAYVWRTDKVGETTVRPLRPQAERQTWRDVGALFLAQVPEAEASARGRAARPTIVNQMAALAREARQGGLAGVANERFVAIGIRTDMKAKVFEWRMDSFELPDSVLGLKAAVSITRALRQAETAAEALGTALLRLHPGTERQNPSWADIRAAMGDEVRLARRRYWNELEPEFRLRLFDQQLVGDEEAEAAWLAEWTHVVRATVVPVLEGVLNASDDSADGLRRQETARHVLYIQLTKGGVT